MDNIITVKTVSSGGGVEGGSRGKTCETCKALMYTLIYLFCEASVSEKKRIFSFIGTSYDENTVN